MDISKTMEFQVDNKHQGQRLDAFLYERASLPSRAFGQKLIKHGFVTVNGKEGKAGFILKTGDVIAASIPPPEPAEAQAEEIPLSVIYEDCDLIVIDKPRGMVVHPAAGNKQGTLVNALLAHCRDLSGIGGVERPGIVHRIDKDTSGILVAAKNDLAHTALAAQLKTHSMKRIYLGIIYGHISPPNSTITSLLGRHPKNRQKMWVVPKGGKIAITHYETLELYPGHALLRFVLETGRTHQIRVHMAYKNHPLVGDPVYAANYENYNFLGQALHASVLGFYHPRTGKYMEFSTNPPGDFLKLVELLSNKQK